MPSTATIKDETTGRYQSPTRESAGPISPMACNANFWRSSAPKHVLDAQAGGWDQWLRHLRKRHEPRPLDQLWSSPGGKKGGHRKARLPFPSLLWGIVQENLSEQTASLLALASMEQDLAPPNRNKKAHPKKKGPNQKDHAREWNRELGDSLQAWLRQSQEGCGPSQTADDPLRTAEGALACLAVAHALPQLPSLIASDRWWELVDTLWLVVQSADLWCADADLPAGESLAQQLLAGELPLTLAYLFPEIKPLYKLQSMARTNLTEGIEELLNGEGLPRGGHLPILRPLLASWTRCLSMGQQMKGGALSRKAREQYLWIVRQALRLSAPDGRSLLAELHSSKDESLQSFHQAYSSSNGWSPHFLCSVLELGGNDSDHAAACNLLGKKMVPPTPETEDTEHPEPADHCEWAGIAVMRPDWHRKSTVLAIDYSLPDMRIELTSGNDLLLSGLWTSKTTLGGKSLEPTGEWEATCWESDEDVDYLELSVEMSGGVCLERQIMLAREDEILLLSDYLLNAEEEPLIGQEKVHSQRGPLKHLSRLPLAPSARFIPEQETREGVLSAQGTGTRASSGKPDRPCARIFPLGMPEWRESPSPGELTSDNGRLQWSATSKGIRLASPLLIDLNRRRIARKCTWRQLTVAQSLQIQGADVAVGYRVQCAKKQWLIYRSLAPKANRTLLGQNFSSESLVGRFLASSGEVDALVEIE